MSNNSQDKTIGNQQERLFDIGYLLGIIDGEGCCQFGYKYLYKGCKVFSPRITIFNTNPNILQKIKDSLDNLEVSYYFFTIKLYGKAKWPGWRIEIHGLKNIKKLTDMLLQYPSGKNERLQVLNDFCVFRLIKKGKKFSEEEQAYFKKLSQLNKLYRSIQNPPKK